MSACIKLTNTKYEYRNEIINFFQISLTDFEIRVKEQLQYETFIDYWINKYYRQGISAKQAIISIYQLRHKQYKKITNNI